MLPKQKTDSQTTPMAGESGKDTVAKAWFEDMVREQAPLAVQAGCARSQSHSLTRERGLLDLAGLQTVHSEHCAVHFFHTLQLQVKKKISNHETSVVHSNYSGRVTGKSPWAVTVTQQQWSRAWRSVLPLMTRVEQETQ